MTEVCDFSSSQDLGAVAQHFSGTIRYVSDYGPKNITATEAADTLALRLTLTLVCEQGNQPALRGAAGGQHDALVANAQADEAGADPRSWVYYVAEDPNVLPQSAWATVVEYFGAVNADSKRPVGGYGSFGLLAHLHALGLITKGWMVQTWNAGAPSPLPPWVCLEQLVGAETYGLSVDADSVLQADYGQTPRPAGPTPSQGGGNMLADDPSSKTGSWALGPDGGIFTADGSQFYGSMAGNRWNWQAVGTLWGIAPWWDGAGWGYKVAVHTTSPGQFAYYRFPSSGALRSVGAAPPSEHPLAIEAARDETLWDPAAGTLELAA